jgi:gliding motility-associated-like protein
VFDKIGNKTMLTKKIFFFALLFVYVELLPAQPIPCEDPPIMTSFCADACIICDIDGFTGRHESTIVGEAPPGFAGECTFVAHNMQWIAFIAGSINLSVSLAVSNCQQGIGLEFGLYKGVDCQNYQRISNCFGGAAGIIGPGQNGVINNTEPLVIGQYYYIVMDGGLGDNCDWTFSVLDGTTQVAPLTTSGFIEGNNTTCPNFLQQYFVDPPVGATDFEWTVNGIIQNSNTAVLDFTFLAAGTYNICITAKNACDEAPPTCYQVEVEALVTEIIDILCEGETYDVAGVVLDEGGFYQFDLINAEGCDSLVTLDLTEIETPLLNLQLNICEGDTLFIGTTAYTQTGVFQEVLISSQDCDSIINLDLFTIVCNISSTDISTPAICHGESSGQIAFNVNTGTAPFTYSWQELNGAFFGSGNINTVGEVILIENIPAGTYVITIDDGFGNFDIIITVITEPPFLELDFVASDYDGFNVSCSDSDDGTLSALVSGGVVPYNYSWDTEQESDLIDQLISGVYELTVTDAGGCTIAGSYELSAPEPILLIAEFRNAECDGPSTGNITAVQTLGGVGGYTFSLNGGGFLDSPVFDGLPQGEYLLAVMDANGCLAEVSGTLIAPQIPEIELGEDYEISLGDFSTLNPLINNIEIQNIVWQSTEVLDCFNCLEPQVMPLQSGYYILSIESIDGCIAVDSVFIAVSKFRKLFVPNVFSPNFDGLNDFFTIFGGPEVAMIRQFSVFNRWGALVFDTRNIEPGIESLGWNGTFKGKDQNTGVYVWMIEVEFIDGVVLRYSGSITLVK